MKQYFFLILILVSGLIAIITFRFDPTLKAIATYSLAGLYFLWGILHHHSTDHLRLKVVLEYFLVSVLAVIIINTLL